MSSEIVEGCRCVVTAGINKGLILAIGSFIGDVPNFELNNNWSCDKPLMTKHGYEVNFVPEEIIKRIDDDKQELSSWEAVAKDCKWNPNEVTA